MPQNKFLSFNAFGYLPEGDISMTIAELQSSILVQGGREYPNWDQQWRAALVKNLEILVKQLWKVDVDQIFVDGSFVEDKDHPNDIDGYFVCDRLYLISGKLQKDLNHLDRNKVWNWDPDSRKHYWGFEKRQLPMWHQYRVELYPHYEESLIDLPSFFRRSRRDGKRRGLIKIVKGDNK